MALSKKHFIELAKIIGENEARMHDGRATAIDLIRLRDAMGDFCRRHNPLFNRHFFNVAIGDARDAYLTSER